MVIKKMGIVFQPCSGKDAIKHYKTSIENKIPYNSLPDNIKEKFKNNEKDLYFWGNTSGKENINLSRGVREINIGDKVLFYRKRRIISFGEVCFIFESETFADKIWGRTKINDYLPYRYVYIMNNITNINLDIIDVNNILERKESSCITGVFRLSDEKKVEKILELL